MKNVKQQNLLIVKNVHLAVNQFIKHEKRKERNNIHKRRNKNNI